jgi:hypothetical protein
VPGALLHIGATVTCAHGGSAQPTTSNPRVLVSGQAAVTPAAPYVVAGCPFVPPLGNGPCVTARWISGATRVFAGGVPVLLGDSQALCAPTETPLEILATQVRVRGI